MQKKYGKIRVRENPYSSIFYIMLWKRNKFKDLWATATKLDFFSLQQFASFFQRKASEIRKSKRFLFSLCCKDQNSLAFKNYYRKVHLSMFHFIFCFVWKKGCVFWKKSYCNGTSTTRNKLLFKYLKLNSKVNSIWLYSHLLQCYPVF